jgi:hypothetical protein
MAIKLEIARNGQVKIEDEGGANSQVIKEILKNQIVISEVQTCGGDAEQEVHVQV